VTDASGEASIPYVRARLPCPWSSRRSPTPGSVHKDEHPAPGDSRPREHRPAAWDNTERNYPRSGRLAHERSDRQALVCAATITSAPPLVRRHLRARHDAGEQDLTIVGSVPFGESTGIYYTYDAELDTSVSQTLDLTLPSPFSETILVTDSVGNPVPGALIDFGSTTQCSRDWTDTPGVAGTLWYWTFMQAETDGSGKASVPYLPCPSGLSSCGGAPRLRSHGGTFAIPPRRPRRRDHRSARAIYRAISDAHPARRPPPRRLRRPSL